MIRRGQVRQGRTFAPLEPGINLCGIKPDAQALPLDMGNLSVFNPPVDSARAYTQAGAKLLNG